MSKKGNGSRKSDSEDVHWQGLEESLLRQVYVEFCRLRYRQTRFANGLDEGYTHDDLAGRIFDALFEFLKKKGLPGFPTKGKIAKRAGVAQNVLTKFLDGAAPKTTEWFAKARELMFFVLLGENPSEKGVEFELGNQICTFFFKGHDKKHPNQATKYFFPERLGHAEPFTRGELASEIHWYIANQKVNGGVTDLTLVSGGGPFFRKSMGKRVAGAVVKAFHANIRVTFVSDSSTPDSRTKENLDNFFLAHQDIKGDHAPLEIDFADPGLREVVPGWWTCLSDVVQYLHLIHKGTDGKTDETLFIVRGQSPPKSGEQDDDSDKPEDTTPNSGPIAHYANEYELARYLRWKFAVDRGVLETGFRTLRYELPIAVERQSTAVSEE